MKHVLSVLLVALFTIACNEKATEPASSEAAPAAKPALEILDMSLADGVKNAYAAFETGNIDGFTEPYDDNVRFIWSAGDSLIGKQAVKDYYTGRWKLIKSLKFTEHIFTPLQVNETQSQYAPTGKWLLHWALANVTYKNDKSLTFWVHNVNHFNDAGKIDFIGQYIDRLPLMEATKGLTP